MATAKNSARSAKTPRSERFAQQVAQSPTMQKIIQSTVPRAVQRPDFGVATMDNHPMLLMRDMPAEPPPPPRASELQASMSSLQAEASHLRAQVEMLAERLKPLLRTVEPEVQSHHMPADAQSPIGQELQLLATGLRVTGMLLQDLLSRYEG